MNELIKKLRASRERVVEISGFTFTYKRPTDHEAAQIYMRRDNSVDIALRFVVGWVGVKEIDIVSGTSDDQAVFSPELWAEWCYDRPDFWEPLREAIMGAYMDHNAQREAVAKN
jgi:hypothetical protein